jgi:predicted lipoprotein with Yx(FWY)xxD motif
MRSAVKFLLPTLVLSLAVAACGSSSKSGSSSQAATTPAATTSSSGESAAVVKTASNATLHATVLVNAQGMTLYSLSAEKNGKFICTSSACVAVWHPLSVSSTAVPSGAAVGSLGAVKRPDGTEQVTYKGMPLYTFAQDKQPGEAGGQGVKDVGTWGAVTVTAASSGAGAATTTSTTATTTPAETPAPAGSGGGGSGGGGYGY